MQKHAWESVCGSAVNCAGMRGNTSTAGATETNGTGKRGGKGTETQAATWTRVTEVSVVALCLE